MIIQKIKENLRLKHRDYKEKEIVFNSAQENIPYSLDSSLFKRCIENLIYNALIHNEKKTKVAVNLYQEADEIVLEIQDDGAGMTEEELDQLFNRYYRGLNTRNHKGTDLGMSIAKEVIEAHEGEIEVESEVNQGTKITIRL